MRTLLFIFTLLSVHFSCEAFSTSHSRGAAQPASSSSWHSIPATAQKPSSHSTVHLSSLSIPICGNGILEDGEECDPGSVTPSCCSKTCRFLTHGIICRAAEGPCDTAEHCSGTSGLCPADEVAVKLRHCFLGLCAFGSVCDGISKECPLSPRGYLPQGAVCRDSRGDCDPQELCTGDSAGCPEDALLPANTSCRLGECGFPAVCDGTSPECAARRTELLGPSSQCRPAHGPCDVPENCDGVSYTCPPDTFVSSGTSCSAGDCAAPSACDGSSASCPATALLPQSTVCRAAAGLCDTAEQCSGTSPSCPKDQLLPFGSECSVGACAKYDFCDGSSATCRFLGRNTSSDIVCAPANRECYLDATCADAGADPSSAACPPNRQAPDGTPCSNGGYCNAGECTQPVCGNGILEVGEECDFNATDASCCTPQCKFAASDIVCASAVGACESNALCTGHASSCPSKPFLPKTELCRGNTSICDAAEYCTGSTAECPEDAAAAAGTPCSAGVCAAPSSCDGQSKLCPTSNGFLVGTVCRPAAGPCDAEELCNDQSPNCPDDAIQAADFACFNGPCALPSSCNGSSVSCPTSPLRETGFVCRPSAGPCDLEEVCPGNSVQCPSDSLVPQGVTCSAGPCAKPFQCDGLNTFCLTGNGLYSNETLCSEGDDLCILPSYCNFSVLCPPHQFKPDESNCSSGVCANGQCVSSSSSNNFLTGATSLGGSDIAIVVLVLVAVGSVSISIFSRLKAHSLRNQLPTEELLPPPNVPVADSNAEVAWEQPDSAWRSPVPQQQ